MTKLSEVLEDDIEVGAFKIKMARSLQILNPGHEGKRRKELHVSDFTKSDESFCFRALVHKYMTGTTSGAPSEIQHDGKFREVKWLERFKAVGILREYQPELAVGLLRGHPDFVLDWGYGNRIVDLTGFDPSHDPILRAVRLKMKKRQVLFYLAMWTVARKEKIGGYVLPENKATSEWQLVPVPYDPTEGVNLVSRVTEGSRWIRAIENAAPWELKKTFLRIPKCRSSRCKYCRIEVDPR